MIGWFTVAFVLAFAWLYRKTLCERLMFTRWDFIIALACAACCWIVAYLLTLALLP